MRLASFPAAVVPASFLACALALAGCGDNLTPAPQNTDTSDVIQEDNSIPGRDPYQAAPPTPLPCVPNLDGKIDFAEIKVGFDVPINYLVPPAGQTRSVDVAGADAANGQKLWDWATDDATDQVAQIKAGTLSGKWYANRFPKGQFTVPVDLGGTLEAVNSLDANGMYIHGIASKEQNPVEGQTIYVYDPPVQALRFPLKPGDDWSSTGIVKNGLIRGLPWAASDTYHVRVDAMGTLKLPDVTFTQVQRVRTDVTINPAVGLVTTQKQVAFYFECFGEVARATSGTGETNDNFTVASEVRRLGL